MTGPELRHIRTSLRMTAAELAERLSVHERTIYKWELSETKISHFVAYAIHRIVEEKKALDNKANKGVAMKETSKISWEYERGPIGFENCWGHYLIMDLSNRIVPIPIEIRIHRNQFADMEIKAFVAFLQSLESYTREQSSHDG